MGAPDKVTYKIKLDLDGIPKADQKSALQDVADYVKEQILRDCSEGRSSVSGKKWAKLTPAYKKIKAKESSAPVANLELTGAMLDSLDYEIKKGTIEIGFFDSDQAAKADGHNNFSGDSKLPLRQSIPEDDQKFRPTIRDEIASILDDYRSEDNADNG